MNQRHWYVKSWFFVLVISIFIVSCAAPYLNEAKMQYEMALVSDNPLPHYRTALEELDKVIKRDPGQSQAYAIKGLIYSHLGEYEQAVDQLEKAKQGMYEGKLQWVPIVMNITYGDIFHARATSAIRSGAWEQARNYQTSALEFFTSVVTTASGALGEIFTTDEFGISMQDLYMKAQARWAAGKSQMATIEGSGFQDKERQSELLREVTARLSSLVETYPDSTSLRYYLAEGYRKRGLTIRRTDPTEGERLQGLAMAQLRVCAELGLPMELRNPAAQLFNMLSKGAEPEIEQKLLGVAPSH